LTPLTEKGRRVSTKHRHPSRDGAIRAGETPCDSGDVLDVRAE
jgi:hypothetical protein